MTQGSNEEKAPPVAGEAKAHEAGSISTVGELRGCAREEVGIGLQTIRFWLVQPEAGAGLREIIDALKKNSGRGPTT